MRRCPSIEDARTHSGTPVLPFASLGGLVALLVEGANEQQGIVEGLLRRVNELEQELQRQKGALPKSAAA